MEFGETVAQANAQQSQGKCVICDRTKCESPKKENIEATVSKPGWERNKSMAGVFDWGDSQRTTIYPNGKPSYPTEGHHCMAFTTFIKDNQDRCVRLNHFLNKVGFRPNQPSNIIQLPDRHGQVPPNASPTAPWPNGVKKEYRSYWVSIDVGHPLQLHLGRHRKNYFQDSDLLYRRMLTMVTDSDICGTETMQDFESGLKDLIKGAVNFAFTLVAQGGWKCHPEHLRIAKNLYGKNGIHTYDYVVDAIEQKTKKVTHEGYPGAGGRPADGQRVTLETTPF